MNDAGESLRFVKDVYDPTDEYDGAIIDNAFSLIGVMRAKKNFALPTRDELVEIMVREGIEGMVRRTWLLSDEERAIAKLKGWNVGWSAGWNEGWNEGRNVLTQLIGLRFPTATTEFIERTLNYLKNPSDVKETVSAAMSTNSFEEFQQRVLMLAPGR